MSKRLYSHKKVRYSHAYDVDEICTLFSDLGLHAQTVRKWIKNGLKTIDKGKPALIYGNDLITYLKKHNNKNKCSTAFDEFFCMSCQDARPTFQNQITVKQKESFLQVQGICRQCKTRMFKNYKLVDLPELKRKLKLVDVLELCDGVSTSSKTHLQVQERIAESESLQGELFG